MFISLSFLYTLLLHYSKTNNSYQKKFKKVSINSKRLKIKVASINFSDVNNFPPLDHPSYLIPKGKYPIIIWWQKWDNRSRNILCGSNVCTVSWNLSQISNPLTRGIIFYGTNFKPSNLPLPRLPHHEWCLFHEESPYTNWILSLNMMILLQRDEGFAPALYVQTNCNPPSDRDTYVKELMKYIQVDAYGPCLNNKKMPELIKGRQKHKDEPYLHFVAQYKFQIAFENANCDDYMTEKVFRPLEIGVVPVYSGSSKVRDFMPSDKAVIVASDFLSAKHLADFLNELNADDEKYNEYLKHRTIGKITNKNLIKAMKQRKWKIQTSISIMSDGFSCKICNELHKRNAMLWEHIKDKSKPIKPLKMANSSHLGCRLPSKHVKLGRFKTASDFGQGEVEALVRMLHTNETDCRNLEKYFNENEMQI